MVINSISVSVSCKAIKSWPKYVLNDNALIFCIYSKTFVTGDKVCPVSLNANTTFAINIKQRDKTYKYSI